MKRSGFTLVEMLVVIILLLILTTLAVAILPNLSDKRAAARAADQVQGWLVQARSKAQRDQMPTGLRLIADGDGMVRRLEFVQQPDPLRLRRNSQLIPIQLGPPIDPKQTASAQFGLFDGDRDTFRTGDLIQVKEGQFDGWYRIDSIPANPDGSLNPYGQLGLIGSDVISTTQTRDYSIIRRWRPLAGEPVLEMPKGTCVDLLKNAKPPTPAPDVDSHYDRPLPIISGEVVILFTPASGLAESSLSRPALWIRHEENKGEPTLIFVVASSGAVGAHPVDPEKLPGMQNRLARPFSFVEDGLGSGL